MLKKMAEVDVKQGLKLVLDKIEAAKLRRPPEFQSQTARLVAASKTKGPTFIVEAYEAGQRHFGENYVQELETKASDPLILEKCEEIKWHYIGHLQTNKIGKVLAVPNLYMIETVDSQRLARKLDSKWPECGGEGAKLNVLVQVNTSGEKEKSGVSPDQVLDLSKFILEKCDNLKLNGLMTIGELGHDTTDGPNPDFLALKNCRDNVCKELGIEWHKFDLSMGMSGDFEEAIELGSTNVRVGSSIFGYRPKKE